MTTLPKFMGGALTLSGCARKTNPRHWRRTRAASVLFKPSEPSTKGYEVLKGDELRALPGDGRRPERAAALASDNLHSLNCLHLHALLHMELAEQRRTQGMCHRCTQNWVACQKCGTERPAGRAGCGHAWLGRKACGAPRLGRSVLVPSSAYPWTGMRGAQAQFDQRKCGEPGAAVTIIHNLRSRF